MKPLRHIPDILERLKSQPFQVKAYSAYRNGDWLSFSTEELINQIHCISLSIKELGLNKGDKVGICAKSSPYWSMIDFAIVLAGGVTVPFFSNLSEEHFLYEVKHSAPRWIFVGDSDDREKAERLGKLFERIITFQEKEAGSGLIHVQELISRGEYIRQRKPDGINELINSIHPEDLATIIYSSGSTGNPKGVELTHKNLVSTIHFDAFGLTFEDRYLSILPLPHIFAKQVHLIMTAWGVPIYFLNDLKQLATVCKQVKITRMITVPKVLEKSYSKMHEEIENSNFLKRHLGRWSLNLAEKEDSYYKKLMLPIADKLVYSKIRNQFGPSFRSILSGGAALSPRLQRFYLSLGIPVLQGWGLTEGSCVAVNRPSNNKIGTVGPPIESVRFKISAVGEVLIKGPTVMRGYHKDPEATKTTIDSEGWLHTGDFGHLDIDGHLVIEGRVNESFKTSQGEFINPVRIEQKILDCPLIEMAMVIGEGHPYPSVLLFPDLAAMTVLKTRARMTTYSTESFLQSPLVVNEMHKLLAKVNSKLNHWENIRDYRFIPTPPTIESGQLTPTLKLRRKAVLSKYEAVVSEIYENKQPH